MWIAPLEYAKFNIKELCLILQINYITSTAFQTFGEYFFLTKNMTSQRGLYGRVV